MRSLLSLYVTSYHHHRSPHPTACYLHPVHVGGFDAARQLKTDISQELNWNSAAVYLDADAVRACAFHSAPCGIHRGA